MSGESQARAEERERAAGEAAKEAARFVCAHYNDAEAWVRLLVTEGLGRETVYHFDAFGPMIDGQPRVTVRQVGADRWGTVLT